MKGGFFLVFVVLFAGCIQPGDPLYPEEETAEVGDKVDYALNVDPIFNGLCGGCHVQAKSAGLDLGSLESVVGSGIVVPCDPEASILYQKVSSDSPESGGSRMPIGGTLSDEEIEVIYRWISEGAAESSAAAGASLCGAIGSSGD